MRPLRIAVVEDSEDCAELLNLYLRDHDVTVFSDPREAIPQLAAGGFDMLLLDYVLPGLSGVDLLRALNLGGVWIPTIVVTGWSLRSPQPLELVRLGVVDIVPKPFEEAQVVRAVNEARRGILRPPDVGRACTAAV